MKESNLLYQYFDANFKPYRDLFNLKPSSIFFFYSKTLLLEHINLIFKFSMKKHSFHI